MSSHPPPPLDPEPMALDTPTPTHTHHAKPAPPPPPTKKTLTLTTATLKNPPFAYAHLALAQPPPPHPSSTNTASTSTSTQPSQPPLDALQVRAYLTAALRQFLGATGAGMPVDILLVTADAAWVRVPRADLAAFAAGVTAFAGLPVSSSSSTGMDGREVSGGMMQLQVRACGDWLGSLIGREEQAGLWR